MSRPAHWALSPLDLQAHLLLPQGCHPQGVFKARCGHLLQSTRDQDTHWGYVYRSRVHTSPRPTGPNSSCRGRPTLREGTP